MAKRRAQIQMSDEEVWAFVEERKSLQVATIGRDGMPHLTTLWFALVEGRIAFETFSKSQKIVNLKRDPRISVLLEDGEQYAELRGVSISGHAELYDDPDEVHPYAMAVMRRNQPEIPADKVDDAARALASKRTAVLVVPERIVSWDHSKLSGGY
ncbi:MAG: TIGR03618 family F420-dependent PPOX class oxidoreductase [Myxococcota bacterium]